MPLFSPTALMMRGGGSASQANPATISNENPWRQGKTRVGVRLTQRATLTVSNNKNKFVLKFAVGESGFTINRSSVQVRIMVKKDGGGWGYTNSLGSVDFDKIGVEQTFDVSKQINGSGVKKLLTDRKYGNVNKHGNGVCYLFFETNTEISSGDYSCKIIAET